MPKGLAEIHRHFGILFLIRNVVTLRSRNKWQRQAPVPFIFAFRIE